MQARKTSKQCANKTKPAIIGHIGRTLRPKTKNNTQGRLYMVSWARKGRLAYATYKPKAQALKRKTIRENTPCWICGEPINFNAHWKAPDSFTADHVKPLYAGGDINGPMLPAHRACNTRRSNIERAHKPKAVLIKRIASHTSRQW